MSTELDDYEVYDSADLKKWAQEEADYRMIADWCQKWGFWIVIFGILIPALILACL